MYLGVDTGGTFTDLVLITVDHAQPDAPLHIRTHKVLSTPEAPERAILQGIAELVPAGAMATGALRITHGSTVATNAALEGKGVRTALITNRGFRDLLSIGRQARPSLFALETPPQAPPVTEELCLECSGRINAQGIEQDPLDAADLERLARELKTLAPRAIAINLLFSFLDPAHEERIAAHLRQAWSTHSNEPLFISCSSSVLPEYREYERGIATWLNASLGPLVQGYLLRLRAATTPSPLAVMQSNGGTIAAEQAAERAVNLLLSGPAGGLAAVRALGAISGEQQLMTFDMGGTSTDVALMDGDINLTTEGRIGPYPVAVPMVDMHTIGAGGGSVASIDAGGILQVGPQSAGAAPGPACYGQGGTLATVTDANLVLGRLPAHLPLAGSLTPNLAAARVAIGEIAQKLDLSIEDAATGILQVANEHMARALRVISVERGRDPAQFRLCCFGGAGGLHICALADALGMRKAMVPANAGVLSALGMLLAPAERHYSRTWNTPLLSASRHDFDSIVNELSAAGLAALQEEQYSAEQIKATVAVDLRYRGQSACLTLPWREATALAEDFHRQHAQRYGHALQGDIDVLNIRVTVSAPARLDTLPLLRRHTPGHADAFVQVHAEPRAVSVYPRQELAIHQVISGPAIITEATATTFLASGWEATVDRHGNLLLEKM